MNETSLRLVTASDASSPWADILRSRLGVIRQGRLTVALPSGETLDFGNGEPHARFVLHSYKPISRLLTQGNIGLAESYMAGDWSSPDLTALFELALANEKELGLRKPGSWFTRIVHRLRHLMNANTKTGSRRNISYHYDLGNAFYETWLDPSMTYSSALFQGNDTLESGQMRKYQAIADMVELSCDDNILEIGCGWGGFSEYAARNYGAHIDGLTLSSEQLAYAQKRYHAAEVDHLAKASLTDYRDTVGSYDKVVSIEMFEAVGYENWDTYFQTIKARLKPGGVAALQIIVIEDDRFEDYRGGVDFIQRYIFPGGMLPSPKVLENSIARNGLRLTDQHYFGQSYADTCQHWQKRFQQAWPQIERMGFDLRFKRMWEYYLSYCEAGFRAGSIDVGIFRVVHAS